MRNSKLAVTGALVLTLMGCAHQKSVDRKVDQELKSEAPVTMGGQMAADSRKLISDSPTLTAAQKDKLLALHARMLSEVTAAREQEAKLKMVLVKTLLNPNSEEAEINNIKRRILDLDSKKTKKMLSALDETREILGRQPADGDRLYRAFVLEGRPGDM